MSYTVSRNPAYISGQYGTSPDLITFTKDGYIIQITSNAGAGVPLVLSDWAHPPFYQFGGGRGGSVQNAGAGWLMGDALTAWTQYNDYPQVLNNTNIQWIQQKYPATFNYWITQGIVRSTPVANAPVNAPPPIIGNTPYLPSASAAGNPPSMAPTGETNGQAFQKLLTTSGNNAITLQNKFNSGTWNPVAGKAGTGTLILGAIAAAYLVWPKKFKKALKH